MSENASNTGCISEEVFDRFRTSRWPQLFGGQMRHSRLNKVSGKDSFGILAVLIAPARMEERDMLEEMGIIKQDPRPEAADDFRDFRFTRAGQQCVRACEGLYTQEEYDLRAEEARLYLASRSSR